MVDGWLGTRQFQRIDCIEDYNYSDLQSGRLKLVERSRKKDIVILSYLIDTTNKLSHCSWVSLVSPLEHAVHTTALSEINRSLRL